MIEKWVNRITVGCLLAVTVSLSAHAQLADKKVLTLSAAKKMVAAAEAEAMKNQWNVVIAVVDDGGHLIYLQRMDGTQTGSIDVAIGKAQTAIAFKRPTKVFDDLAKTRPAIVSLPAATLLEGGVPIKLGDQFLGAIGVSGVTSQQDAQVAEAGLAALSGQ
ncbi:MAG TPA: heme-binding protein [Burkholderiales bacterium]|nr:heme-binding protein [Burkholderiales bacterium]